MSFVKGTLCLLWMKYEDTIDPYSIEVQLPPEIILINNTERSRLGNFVYDENFDGFYEFQTPIWANLETSQLDGSFPVGEGGPMVGLSFNELTRRLTIDNPLGGMAVGPGQYGIEIKRDFVAIGATNGLYDVPVDLNFGDFTTRINKVFAHRSQVLSHLPAGMNPSVQLESEVVINNPHDRLYGTRLDVYDPQGNPASVSLGGMTGNRFSLSLPSYGSWRSTVGSPAQLTRYWGVLNSFSDLEGGVSTVYTTRFTPSFAFGMPAPAPAGVAGISTAPLSTHHTVGVVRSLDGTGTALAVVNPSSATARLDWELRSGGELVATAQQEMPSMHQDAFFFEQRFPEMDLSEFSGSLALFSDTDVALISLSTHNGVAQASLVSGSPRR